MNQVNPLKIQKRWALIIPVVLLLMAQSGVQAQQPIIISVFNESTSIPYTTFFGSPIHPGLQAGSEFKWKQGRIFELYPTVNLGYMLHQKLFQGLYINVELAFDVRTGFGLNIKSRLGLGYLHTFTTQQEYRFSDGRYEPKADKGNSRLMPSFTLGLGYDLKSGNPTSPEIFILYKSWLEYPYSPGFIPLMSHSDMHLGVKLYPFKTQQKP